MRVLEIVPVLVVNDITLLAMCKMPITLSHSLPQFSFTIKFVAMLRKVELHLIPLMSGVDKDIDHFFDSLKIINFYLRILMELHVRLENQVIFSLEDSLDLLSYSLN